MGNLAFQLPEKHPAIVGVKNSRVLLNTAGLSNLTQKYLNELPNCLDDHVTLIPPAGGPGLDLGALKTKLKTLGYKGTDRVSVASPRGIIGPPSQPLYNVRAVSYTHLTLPTILLV